MKNKILLLFVLLLNYMSLGQNQNAAYSPKIIPPSPNAAALGKFGNVPVSIYTGIPQINIPIYTLTSRKISIPIGVSYHASGIKVADEASRVGLGWALNAGGSISRTIVGEDDFSGSYFSTGARIPLGPTTEPTSKVQYYRTVSDSAEFINKTTGNVLYTKLEPDIDFQPDIYTFNFGGVSGRFSFTRDKVVVLGKHEKIKIQFKQDNSIVGDGSYWEITTSDGVLYTFKQTEQTFSSSDGTFRTSSWHLTEVLSPDGDKIKFEYVKKSNAYSSVQPSISETKTEYSFSSRDNSSCEQGSVIGPFFTASNSYTVVYLSQIKTVNEIISFDYQDREDLINEVKLSTINVKSLDGKIVYKFNFLYEYFIGESLPFNRANLLQGYSDTKRLKLLSIQKCSGDGMECLPKHEFTYNEGSYLPTKSSLAIDHWGYFNGKDNGTLIPDYAIYPSGDFFKKFYGVMVGTQRESSLEYSKVFTLNKIKYPTGGVTKFEFEASDFDISKSIKNDQSVVGSIQPVENKIKSINYGYGSSGIKKEKLTIKDIVGNASQGEGTINLEVFAYIGGNCNRTLPSTPGLAYVKIINLKDNTVFDEVDLFTSCLDNISPYGCPVKKCNDFGQLDGISYSKSLTGKSGDYEIQIYSGTGSELADIQVSLKWVGYKDLINNGLQYSGNLRIRSISDSDSDSSSIKTSVRRYEYGSIESINGVQSYRSWGRRMSDPKYSYFDSGVKSESMVMGTTTYTENYLCYTLRRSSNSTLPLSSSASGSIIGYDRVVEYIEESNKNISGKIEYNYVNEPDIQYNYGYSRPPIYSNTSNPDNGNLISKYEYIKNGSEYILSSYNKNEFKGITYPVILWGADVRSTDIGNNNIRAFLFYQAMPTSYNYLTKSIQRTYDLNNLQPDTSSRAYTDIVSEYFYENSNHLQLTKKQTYTSSVVDPLATDSKVQRLKTEYKYPLDLAVAGNDYQLMVDNFIHSPIVREENYLEKVKDIFTLLNRTNITFTKRQNARDLGVNPLVGALNFPPLFTPLKVTNQQGPLGPEITTLEFLSYDTYGNLLSYKEKNGLTNTFTYFSIGSGKAFLPQTYTNALNQTITYEYEPIIGLKSIKDPNSFVTTYEYDKLGRLLRTKDQIGDINSYTYNYGSLPSTFTAIGAATGLNSTIQECKLCCTADASATSNSPIQNCTSGQIELKSGTTVSGDDVNFQWKGPGGFASTLSNPKITTNLPNYTGVFTVTVTKQNSTCLATATSTVSVIVNCPCPFTIDVNSTPTTTLTCQQTIALVGNCVGCSTGDLITGQETYVTNGKFDNGDNDFQSDVSSRFITLNAQDINGSFNSFQDHSGTGNRNMLMIGHSESTSEKVWYKTITVTPNTRYILSAWIASAYQNNQTALNWEIDGILQSTGISLAGKNGGDWQNLKNIWISGEQQTSVTIAIRKQNVFGHNWFLLDDISFTEVPPMAKFEWTGPDSYMAIGKNSFVRNVGLKNSGQYQLKVTDKGCTRVATVNQNVNCTACVDPEPLELIATSNSPVSCGGTISLNASSKRGVTYTWYKINDDGSLTDFPTVEKNKATPTITAPSINGINRYTYAVYGYKAGCTASYTVPVEVRCYPDGFIDLALNLRTEGGFNNVTAGQEFTICADVTNQDQNQYRNAASVRVKAELPSCLQLTGSYYGFDTGNTISGHFYEDIWNGPAANEVSNISTDARRGVDVWRYWGVGVGANETRSMCFGVRALSAGPIVIKAQVVEATDPNGQYLNDSDSEPNNGYDNGEDDRSILILNSSAGSINTSLQIISKSYSASSSDFDVVSSGLNWTATKSDSWISLNKTSGGNGTNAVTVSVTENQSAFSRYGSITIDAGCGNTKVIKVKQAGRDDCPTVQLSSNNPFCGATLQLNANVVPAANKELVSNGTFEKGNVDFDPEYMHYYDFQGGTRAYIISANPQSDGFWFARGECPGTNTNPQCSVVNRVRVLFRGDGWYDHILGAKIQGSNNRSTWDDLYTIQSTSTTWQDFTFANTQKYMYVRFVSGSNGNGEIREIEFYNNTTKLSGQLFGSVGIQGTDALANAVDGDPNTIWKSTTTSQESFIGLELTGCSLSGNLPTSQSGYGKQMVVSASWIANAPFWSQTIMVEPNQDYVLSVKGVQLGNYDTVPIKLQFDINGRPTEVMANLPLNGCEWKKISGIWNSGPNFGPVKLTLRFVNSNANDKHFAIDDISVKVSTSGSVSAAPISYTWVAPNPTAQNVLQTANIPNPTIANVSAAHNGIYKLTATQNSCAVTESIEVDVACSSQTCPAPNISSPNRLLCANMGQTTTLTATGCPAGSTVEWSTGQTGTTITTPVLTTVTDYFAQCRTSCGLSTRSNKVTIVVMGLSEPPVINAPSTIEVSPGQAGLTLTASGCSSGYIRWMNGTVGNTIQLPSLGYAIGTTLNVTAQCVNDCGESILSNKVKVIVVCKVEMPSNIQTISPTPCGNDINKSVTLSASCNMGTVRWNFNGVITSGNTYTFNISKDSKLDVSCYIGDDCISQAKNVDVYFTGSMATPDVVSNTNSPENSKLSVISLGNAITLASNGCSASDETRWQVPGFSNFDNINSRQITFTPNTIGDIIVKSYCKNNSCQGSLSTPYTVRVISPCSQPKTLTVTPTNPTVFVGQSLSLTASSCTNGKLSWSYNHNLISSTLSGSLILPVPTNQTPGKYTYTATCSQGTCSYSEETTVTINNPPISCPLSASLSIVSNTCGNATLRATTTNGTNPSYSWYFQETISTNQRQLTGITSTEYSTKQSGIYCVKVLDGTCEVQACSNLTISSLLAAPTVSTTSLTINKGESVTLQASGCNNGTILKWYSLPDDIEIANPVSPTTTTRYAARCVNTTPGQLCQSDLSTSINVNVICTSAPPSLRYKSPTTKVCQGQSITLTATGCSGTIKWYNTSASTVVVAQGPDFTTTGSEAWATCTNSGSTCESSKVPIETNDFKQLTVLANCELNVLSASVTDISNLTYEWQYKELNSNTITILSEKSATLKTNNIPGEYIVSGKIDNTYCTTSSSYRIQLVNGVYPSLTPKGSISYTLDNCNTQATVLFSATASNILSDLSITIKGMGSDITDSGYNSYSKSLPLFGEATQVSKNVKLIVSNSSGCKDERSVDITLYPKLTVPTINTKAICFSTSSSSPITLEASGCPADCSYEWSVTGISGNFTGTSINVTPTTTSTFKVRCSRSVNCKGSYSETITLNPCPSTGAGGTSSGCSNLKEYSSTNTNPEPDVKDFDFPVSGDNKMLFVFEAFCIPDQLEFLDENNQVILVIGCNGTGCKTPWGSPCQNTVGTTTGYVIPPTGKTIKRFKVTKACSPYKCDQETSSSWRLTVSSCPNPRID